jgi:hypothetical protein
MCFGKLNGNNEMRDIEKHKRMIVDEVDRTDPLEILKLKVQVPTLKSSDNSNGNSSVTKFRE